MQASWFDDTPATPRPRSRVLSVTLLVSSARLALERQLGVVWVAGEISNLYRASSGHVYFTLKDAAAQVKCTLYRSKAQLVGFALRDGLAVEVRALPSIFDARGEFQLNVDAVRHAGLGQLYERFAALKAKLDAQGWLAPERKRPLPRFPRAIGIVTSPRGAALRDVLTTLERRWPALRVVIYPASVQGDAAGQEVARAIAIANAREEVDVLVVCRGGGSIEDLWAFNEESVARAVHESRLPVVSGVGHETDFTICDFVADLRAPTPTAAATVVSPDGDEHCRRAKEIARRLARAAGHALATRSQRADVAARRLVHPAARLRSQHERLGALMTRLARCFARGNEHRRDAVDARRARLLRELRAPLPQARRIGLAHDRMTRNAADRLARASRALDRLAQNLAHLDPRAVLGRGYAIVSTENGDIVVTSEQLAIDKPVTLTLARGSAVAIVKDIEG
ncbi:MAG TPA: exodeoxyribonuclease VII large subunit [Casimicrobiaceae bacterium]|nr:exodeoxyribonuclease VII large subunit [Casimicrobiaceae bacterium]